MNVCFIFPGQGSQYVGMGKDLYDSSPEAKAIFDQAEKLLPGLNFKKLCFQGPIEELTQTANSQVAILVTSIAALKVFEANAESFRLGLRIQPIRPLEQYSSSESATKGGETSREDEMISICSTAGLSLGEYSALVASGALEFSDAVRLVRRRGELMEQAAKNNPGAMASILGISIDDLKDVLRESGSEIANLNSPGQVVISGKKESVAKAMALAGEKGAKKSILLNVSGPFHSSFMREAGLEFKKELDKARFTSPSIPIVSNVTADYEKSAEDIKENLVKQLYSPVRWEESIIKIKQDGCKTFFEIGPGKVLKGLLRRIDPELVVYNVETTEDIKNLII